MKMTNVLIVEADPMVAHIIERYLKRQEGIKAYGPVNSLEDICAILDREYIHLILLDVYLPNGDGLELLQQLREAGYYNSVIMVTAANKVEDITKAYAYGVMDYILKPFDIARLDKAVRKHLAMVERLSGKKILTQNDLDREDILVNYLELPKGLNRDTYMKVLEKMQEDDEREWTLRELAGETKISNVTIKKYIDYMEQMGQVETHLIYGQVGRPEYRFFFRT